MEHSTLITGGGAIVGNRGSFGIGGGMGPLDVLNCEMFDAVLVSSGNGMIVYIDIGQDSAISLPSWP